MINYEHVDVQDFLVSLDVSNVHIASASEVCFSCPFAGHVSGDENPSAYMNLGTTAWMCHGCKRRGNCVSFMADLENISPMLATRFIKERWDSAFREPNGSMLQEVETLWMKHTISKKVAPRISALFLDQFVNDWYLDTPWSSYMVEERGFDPDTLDLFQCGYDPISERITIAVFDDDDQLLGFKGRSWRGAKAKYLVIGDSPRSRYQAYGFQYYPTSEAVFGLNFAKGDKPVIICEGELNAMALQQKGFHNAVALSGSNVSETQRRLVNKHAEEVVLFFDSDEAGQKGTELAIGAFESDLRVKIVPDHIGDPADMSAEAIADCLENAESSVALSVVGL